MMVTALISVARKERHAAHQGMRRRARKKSAVPRCSRLKAPPMTMRKASDAARMAKSGQVSADPAGSAMGSRHYGPTPRNPRKLRTGFLPELLEQVREGAALEKAVELGLVAAHQAEAVDVDVIHGPAPLRAAVQAVLDRNLGSLGRHHARLHPGIVALDPFADIRDGLARVLLDPAHVRVGDEAAEEANELLLFGRRGLGPRLAQGALRHLFEVEEGLGDLADLGPPLRDGGRLDRGAVRLRKDLLHRRLHRLRRAGRRRRARGCQHHRHNDRHHRVAPLGSLPCRGFALVMRRAVSLQSLTPFNCLDTSENSVSKTPEAGAKWPP